jgi:2-amino-4-hydroxy-6-hydroxymethyldihydropteridine diphosphokinase
MINEHNSNPILSVIALGSNLGNSQETLELALKKISEIEGISLKNNSSWYKTAPIGPEQPDYINGCALLEVSLEPHQLLKTLLKIEDEFGRVRKERWGARILDLDVIIYGDLILGTPDLQIPHPRMTERAFVLVPLSEIAPNLQEPKSGLTILQLLEKVDKTGVKFFSSNSTLNY